MNKDQLFHLFNISIDSDDEEVKTAYVNLLEKTEDTAEKKEIEDLFQIINTEQKRYIYYLTATKGFSDITELDSEIISRPNYIGPRQWLELLDPEN